MQKSEFLKALSDMWKDFDSRVLRYKVCCLLCNLCWVSFNFGSQFYVSSLFPVHNSEYYRTVNYLVLCPVTLIMGLTQVEYAMVTFFINVEAMLQKKKFFFFLGGGGFPWNM